MSPAAVLPTGRVRPRRVSWSGTLPTPGRPAVPSLTPGGTGWNRDAVTLRRVLAALETL